MTPTEVRSTVVPHWTVRWIRHHPLPAFFILTFVPSWIYELGGILVLHLPLVPWMFAAPFVGPFQAAFVVTAVIEGRTGVRALWRDLVRFRVGLRWYLLVLFGVPALLMLCVLPLAGFGAFDPVPGELGGYLVGFLTVLLVGGPLGEEPGWRCFATPRLRARYGSVLGTAVLGVGWGLWHLPLFMIEGYNHSGSGPAGLVVPYLVFLVFTTVVSYLFTWVYHRTAGSGPVAILLHTCFNASLLPVLFPGVADSLSYEVVQDVAFALLAVVLIVSTKARLGSSGLDWRRSAAPTESEDPGDMRKWALLAGAIIAEVIGTMSLRATVDKPLWIPVVVAGYLTAFVLLGLTLRAGTPIGIAYGVWGACGVALTAVLGAVIFAERLSLTTLAGIAVIIAGVVTIEIGSRSHRPDES